MQLPRNARRDSVGADHHRKYFDTILLLWRRKVALSAAFEGYLRHEQKALVEGEGEHAILSLPRKLDLSISCLRNMHWAFSDEGSIITWWTALPSLISSLPPTIVFPTVEARCVPYWRKSNTSNTHSVRCAGLKWHGSTIAIFAGVYNDSQNNGTAIMLDGGQRDILMKSRSLIF